jgi:DNA-binding transcriptional MerR regulator
MDPTQAPPAAAPAGADPLADLPDDLELDLDGLEACVARLLGAAAPALGDGRVRDKPDLRTLRYYQSLGLIDRPLRYEGRRALYGARHALQAACVKLLQAEGLSLAQAQPALAGRSTADLRAALRAALPAAPPGPSPGAGPPAPARAAPAALLQFPLAPGVALLVDPALVPDPGALAAAVSAFLLTLPPLHPPGARP